MGFKNIHLTLDNMPPNGYPPGSTMTGRVITSTYQSIHIRSLIIKVYGEANVRFTDTVTRTRTRVNRFGTRSGMGSRDNFGGRDITTETTTDTEFFTGFERYISTSYTILGETLIQPGEQEFTFSVILPSVLPSSFSGSHGSIKYWIKVKMDKAWNFDQSASAEFRVFCPKDLNIIDFITAGGGRVPRKIDVPQTYRETKHFNFLCCRTGPLSLTAELDKSGLIPGQNLNITIEVDNATNVNISRVKITLMQEVIWIASNPRSNSRTTTNSLLVVHCDGVDKSDNRSWRQPVIIPEGSCINVDSCSIIKLQHFIMVEAIPEGMHMTLTLKAPVVIGTKPLRSQFSQPVKTIDQPYVPPPPNIGFVLPSPSNPGFIDPQGENFRPTAPAEYTGFVHPEPPPPYPTTPDSYMAPPVLSKK